MRDQAAYIRAVDKRFVRVCRSCALVFFIGGILGADEVIQVDRRGIERRRTGEILDYRGDQLTMRSGGREITVPAAQIKRIEADWIAPHRQADAAFLAGEFETALVSYRTALKQEPRAWVQRRLLARIIWCQRNTGRIAEAFRNFSRLVGEDTNTPYFDAIPLAWRTSHASPTLQRLGRDWLGSENVSVQRLIAASWLLSTSDRSTSIGVLRQLARNPRQEIADLAKFQLWRTRLVHVKPGDVKRWEQEIESLPEPLRAGPYFLLGQSHASLKNFDEAMLAFLRIPTLFASDARLSQAALFEAARVAESDHHLDEAVLLYRRTTALDAESVVGRQARERLAQLSR